MTQELNASQKENKQGSQTIAELRVINSNLDNQLNNIRRELDEARQDAKRAQQANTELQRANTDAEGEEGLRDVASGEKVSLSEA